MLKNISKLGSVLNKQEQKIVKGGIKDAKDLEFCKKNYEEGTREYKCCVDPVRYGCL